MAGHSKFKNIMYRKGAQDKKKAAAFAKLSREITVAARAGGEDLSINARLRLAVQNAKSESVPKDNIQRAIAKGVGAGTDQSNLEEIRYEGYGPEGIAVIVETMTDNRNRTASNIRMLFSKIGGNLGTMGSVIFLFQRVGEIIYPNTVCDFDTFFEKCIEAGCNDVIQEESEYMAYVAENDFHKASEYLMGILGNPRSSQIIWKPNSEQAISKKGLDSFLRFIENLEMDEDVQSVFFNATLPHD